MDSLTSQEKKFLKKLNTPEKIQDYLDSIPFNHEVDGETCMSPRRVLREQKAHCLEGALLASCALMINNKKTHIISLKVTANDYDHVITLYEQIGRAHV